MDKNRNQKIFKQWTCVLSPYEYKMFDENLRKTFALLSDNMFKMTYIQRRDISGQLEPRLRLNGIAQFFPQNILLAVIRKFEKIETSGRCW